MNSNSLPQFSSLDIATRNRLCIIPCQKQWKDKPKLNLTEIDCLGNEFKKQIKQNPEQARSLLEQDGLDALFTPL